MNKIIKIDQQYCYVGNLEDKSMIKVVIENGYEGMNVGDYVDVFSDGSTHFITKKEKVSTISSLVQDLPKISKPLIELDRIDLSFVRKIQWIDKFKNTAIWLSAGIFMAVCIIASVFLTLIINSQVDNFLSDLFYGMSNVSDTFKFNPAITLFFVLMSNFSLRMTQSSIFGTLSVTLSMLMPVLIISIPLYILSVSLIRKFIYQKNQNLDHMSLFVDSSLSSVLSIILLSLGLSLVAAVLSSGQVKVSFDFIGMIVKNVVILFLINGLFYFKDVFKNKKETLLIQLMIFVMRKAVLLALIGAAIGLYLSLFVFKSSVTLLGIGNLAFLYPASVFGGSILLNSDIIVMSRTSLFSSEQLSVVLYWISLLCSVFVWFIDANELSMKITKLNPYLVGMIQSITFGVVLWLMVSISLVSFSINAMGYGAKLFIKAEFLSFFVVVVFLVALTSIRIYLGDKVDFLNQIKIQYDKLVGKSL